MRTISPLLFVVLIGLLDFYVYNRLKKSLHIPKKSARTIFSYTYWIVSAGLITAVLFAMNRYHSDPADLSLFQSILNLNGVFLSVFAFKFLYAVFSFLIDSFVLVLSKIKTDKTDAGRSKKGNLQSHSRAEFLKKAGLIMSMVPVLGIIHGIGWGRFNFTFHRSRVSIQGLPRDLVGFRIVQLSDAHLGSMLNHKDKIQEVFEQINELKPDIIVFTGDMVNNFSHEMSGWVHVWKRLKAKYGKYSVLGNHDYGNYSEWPSETAKKKNTLEIIRQQKEMGFDVLLNENRQVLVNDEVLNIVGVENWGKPPFPQHGNIEKAMRGIDKRHSTILLSHDPDHFEHQILGKQPVDLTLSGHTHGAQFGIEIGNFKFSPVQLKYKRWAGLYTEKSQKLYVNRGLGYLAFPGRVGIWPEITVIELTR